MTRNPVSPTLCRASFLLAILLAACDGGSGSPAGGTQPSSGPGPGSVLVDYWDATLAADLDGLLAVSAPELAGGLVGRDGSERGEAQAGLDEAANAMASVGVAGIEIVRESVDGAVATVVYRFLLEDPAAAPAGLRQTHERRLRRYADRWLVLPER
jgi:hypothetical protein